MFGLKFDSYIIVQALTAGCVNLAELINGFAVGWTAPIIPKLQDPDETPLPYLLSDTHQAWIASALYFGGIGAFIGGYLSNKIGRKKALVIGGVVSLLSNVLLAAARNLAMVYIGRLLVGCGVGMLTVVELIYIGEIAPPNIRGIILATMGVFHAAGSLLVYSVGPFLSYASVGFVVIALTVVFIVTSCFLPESPMFFVIKNDEASARSAFQHLGQDVDISNELKTMMEKFREQQQQKHIWRELFTIKSNKISLFITIFLAFFQQSSGIIAVIFFGTTIFKDAGSSIRPDLATIIVGATFTVGSCFSPVFIEKYGRRILLMVSTAGCCISMTVLGVYFYLRLMENPNIDHLGWVPLTSLVFGILIYSVGLSIIPNTLLGELFTPKARGLGPSISMVCGFMSGFLSTQVFGYTVVAFGGHVSFWIYAVINGLAFLFVMIFVPETKGKSLMEIQIMLEKGSYSKQIL